LNTQDHITPKSVGLNLLLAAIWTAAGYVVFVGGVCMWVGVSNIHRQGFWVPILAGCLTIGIVLWWTFTAAAWLRSALRQKAVE
jgi:membrane protein implicated in regulation of membrane protease activity